MDRILPKRLFVDVNPQSSGEVHQTDLTFSGSLDRRALHVNSTRHEKMIGMIICIAYLGQTTNHILFRSRLVYWKPFILVNISTQMAFHVNIIIIRHCVQNLWNEVIFFIIEMTPVRTAWAILRGLACFVFFITSRIFNFTETTCISNENQSSSRCWHSVYTESIAFVGNNWRSKLVG